MIVVTESTAKLRRPPEIRRRMLLDAAREVIAARGLHATTLRQVAAAGGVAVGTVTYHFASLAELLAGVVQAEMDSYSAGVWDQARAAPTGRAGLDILIAGLLASGERAGAHWRLWLDFWAVAAHDPAYSAWQSRVYAELHGLVGDLLGRGAVDGSLRAVVAHAGAVGFVAHLDGLVVQAYRPGSRFSPARARAMMADYVATGLAL